MSKIFKAYDIRGVYPEEINEEIVYKIAQAYAKFFKPGKMALGRDVRLSGPQLWEAAKQGLVDHGVDVVDIGVVSTDMMYFAVAEYGYDGGITISASHNPREYNGMKLVRKGAIPISGDSGIMDLKEIAMAGYVQKSEKSGSVESKDIQADYLKKCLSVIDSSKLKSLKIVANGMFGPAIQNLLQMNLPGNFTVLNGKPDGSFPKGAPDPLLEENRIETIETVRKVGADFGGAWDADADRFFLFDETGRFIPGYYLTAFLGKYFCEKQKGAKVLFDPRATWAVIDSVKSVGGVPIMNKAGHSFIKERMRSEDAVFGGEMSGHFYFRDFFYCDNGLIPFLIIWQVVSESGKKVSELFQPYFDQYYTSGEINSELASLELATPVLQNIETKYADSKKDYTDGLSIEYPDWRANIRGSNTQPLLRLNVEAKSQELTDTKTKELLELIRQGK